MITIFEKLYSDFTPIKLRIQVVKESLSEHGDGGGVTEYLRVLLYSALELV